MIKVGRILFFGELPSKSVHGITIANSINIEMLKSKYNVDILTERNKFNLHNRFSVKKIIYSFSDCIKISYKALWREYQYFYLVFSLSSSGSLKTLSAILAFRLLNRGDVVLHIHRGDFFSRFYKGFLNKFVTKFILKFSKKIIVLSDEQRKEFETRFKYQFFSLPNTITKEICQGARSIGDTNFLFISNYLVDKGIFDLLEVFRSLSSEIKGIRLKCFGEFTDTESRELLASYNSYNISVNGPVGESEKYNELLNADCLVLPSWNEGQPLILLEAMSVKTPVISSEVGLIPVMLGYDYPFLIKPGDRLILRQKLLEFINFKAKNELGEHLFSRYQKCFSRNVHYDILFTVFS